AHAVEPPLLVEVEEARARGRGAEGSQRGGRVKARGVVPGPEERAQAALELDAGHQCGEQVRATSALALDEGEERGHDGRRGVAAHHRVGVVEVEGVLRVSVYVGCAEPHVEVRTVVLRCPHSSISRRMDLYTCAHTRHNI